MLNKIAYVADYEGRSVNSHVLVLIRESIHAFEQENRKIKEAVVSIGGSVAEPTTDVYSQIVQMVNAGAVKGDPGDTPVRGTDYWTEADIASMQAYCEEMILEGKW